MHLRIFFLLILCISPLSGFAQILDDSTKLLYGPKTTRYVLEEDIINNNENLRTVDTSIYDLHNYQFLFNGRSVYQNLGNLGTPVAPIYYLPPSRIGKNLGYHSFEPYAFHSDEVKYYDTRSPYTSIYYIQGTNGQQVIDAEFSRNIKPNWNFGFDIRKMTSNKVIGVTSLRDRQADHFSFLGHTRFFTKNERYQILLNYSFLDHKNFETGGIRPDSGETRDDLFDYRREIANLQGARSFEKRSSVHAYQQFSLTGDKYLQLFHIFDYKKQSNRFNDLLPHDSLFYPGKDTVLPGIGASERSDYELFENKAGIKGRAGDLSYRAYYRRKDFSYKQYYSEAFTSLRSYSENFFGGNILYQFSDTSNLNISAEHYIGKDYSLKADYKNKYFSAGHYLINHSPTLVQLNYTGNRFEWHNEEDFNNTLSNNSYLSGNFKWGIFTVNPRLTYSLIKNHIYFDTLARPAQFNSLINILSLDMMLKVDWKNIHLHNFIKYTSVSSSDIIPVPEIYNHCRIFYQNKIFKKALLAQIGFDLYWKSGYYANNYMTVTQQFYLNSNFIVPGYLLADVFLNFQLKKVLGFLKFSHVNQGTVKDGYFVTPYYTGMPRTFEFGLKWMFFD